MNLNKLRFENMDAAWGFVAVFVVILAYVFLFLWRRRVMRRAGDLPLLRQLASQVSKTRQVVNAIFVVAALVLIVLTLMRPRYGVKDGAVTNAGIDLAIALDVSKSMKVRDVVPERLEGARLEINALLDRLQSGRVSLVPFAGVPFVQSPLTHDFGVIKDYLRDLRISDMPVGGTAVGRALREALATLEPESDKNDKDKGANSQDNDGLERIKQFAGSKHKAIILYTDGEDHDSEPLEVAKLAAEAGVRIFTVGVGTRSGNAIPILTDDGSVTGYMKAEDGKTPLISELNEPLLREIAEITGGQYFQYANRSVADDVYAQIDKLEKQEYEARFAKLGEDRFQFLLLPGIFLLLLEIWIGDRRRTKKMWNVVKKMSKMGRNSKKSPSFAATAILTSLLVAANTFPLTAMAQTEEWENAWYVTTNDDVDEGNQKLRDGNGTAALAAYTEAQKTRPESAELHYNIGLAYLLMNEFEKAATAFGRAMETAPAGLRTKVLYCQGLAYARWGEALEASKDGQTTAVDKWKLAVEAFEKVLLTDRSHEDAKWNLEIALLRVDPPCHKRNDEYEPNNSAKEAKPIELQENPETDRREAKLDLTLCPDDEEWFGVALAPGDRLEAELLLSSDDKEGKKPAPVELSLLSPDGTTTLLRSIDTDPSETTIAFGMVPAQAGYFLRVRGIDDEEHAVALEVRIRPPCSAREDDLEDNDTVSAAVPLPEGKAEGLRICPDDPDWFSVGLGEGESLVVYASARGNYAAGFGLQIYDGYGRMLSTAAIHQDSRVAVVLEPGVGDYFVRVEGTQETEAPYDIALKVLPPCPVGNDALEPNDTPETAKTLDQLAQAQPGPTPGGTGVIPAIPGQPGMPGQPLPGVPGPAAPPVPMGTGGEPPKPQTALLRICAGDVDYVRVALQGEEKKVATILFDHSKGDLDLDLLNADGSEVIQESKTSTAEKPVEAVALDGGQDGREFLLRVQGHGEAENFYVLQLVTPPPPNPGDKPQEQNDQEQSEDEQQDGSENQNQQQDQAEKPPEEKQPEQKENSAIEDALNKLDRNPENLEAQEALRRSPIRNWQPDKDW
ncbi:MAG: VWA domain-containing protein [Myxococcales bacterium]|nr:VWA domain-containing protein [Myxococcales bacterium]